MTVSRMGPVALVLLALAAAAPARADDGRYYVFRTLDSANPPTDEQNARCDAYFGARSRTATTRLNALLFSFRIDPATSRLTDQTARTLGPGFICGAPIAGRTDAIESYAYTALPGAGEGESTGTCGLQPIPAQPGASYFTCKLGLVPNEAIGLRGGLVTSNSVVNPRNAVPGTPTGSVWTAYFSERPGTAPPAGPTATDTPPDLKGDTGGIEFYVTRAFDEGTPEGSPACGPGTEAIRTSTLRSVQPDLESGEIPKDAAYRTIGTMTVCYGAASGDGRVATGELRLGDPAHPLVLGATGECRELPAVDSADRRAQSCSLTVDSGEGVRSGLVTSNGLVPAGDPAGSANSAVWTVSLFGGEVKPAPDTGEGSHAPAAKRRTTVRVRAARRARVLSGRWSAGAGSPRFDVQVARAGSRRWRTVLRSTTKRATRVRVKRRGIWKLRARADSGPWTAGRARVR